MVTITSAGLEQGDHIDAAIKMFKILLYELIYFHSLADVHNVLCFFPQQRYVRSTICVLIDGKTSVNLPTSQTKALTACRFTAAPVSCAT